MTKEDSTSESEALRLFSFLFIMYHMVCSAMQLAPHKDVRGFIKKIWNPKT